VGRSPKKVRQGKKARKAQQTEKGEGETAVHEWAEDHRLSKKRRKKSQQKPKEKRPARGGHVETTKFRPQNLETWGGGWGKPKRELCKGGDGWGQK